MRTLVVVLLIAAAGTVWFLHEQRRVEQPGVVTLEEAFAQVQRQPRDARAWAALADAQSAIDQLRAAEESYRTAMRLSREDPHVLGRLGFLLYGRGQDAAALPMLEQARFHGVQMPLLDSTIDTLRAALRAKDAPEVAEEAPEVVAAEVNSDAEGLPDEATGPCTVPLQSRGTFRVTVDIEGHAVPVIFDTGASITTLNRTLLEEVGIPIDESATINAITAAGPVRFPTAMVPAVGLAGRSVKNVTVAVCPGCGGKSAGGLLGLDVQAAMGIQLDLRAGALRFTECEE